MNILFLSDLHLSSDHPETTTIFINLLRNQAKTADAVYILGDLFETWIGDDESSEFNQQIIAALKALTSTNIPVYLMHGNRDFLIGKKFLQTTGCQLIKDPTLINLYGTPTLLMHGDTLCTDDIAYQNYRNKAQNPLFKKIFLALPLFIRKKIAESLRQKSKQETQLKTSDIMDVNLAAVKNFIKKYEVKLLIHGHTHRPCIQYLFLENDLACRVVLSDWHEHGSVLICSSSGERRLCTI